MTTDSATLRTLTARTSVIGEDTTIRRALPHREQKTIGAWCFLDHVGPAQFAAGKGMHVGAHPHIGLQTFTWMIEGELYHRDSAGHQQIVKPGQVNLMTAGHGIVHTEDSVQDGARLHAAQLWIALPDNERQRAPGFRNYPELPVVEQNGYRITVLAGSLLAHTSPVEVFTPLCGADFSSSTAARTELPLETSFEYGVLVLQGKATVNGTELEPGHLAYLPPGSGNLNLSCDAACRVLLIGGEPLQEDLLLWWNFVGRNQAELEQALQDWNQQSSRFPAVPGSSSARLEAPALAGMKLKI